MVIGESEISGQVRAALAASRHHMSPSLQRLFQTALATSKTVATRTQLGQAGRSVASVALDLADARHGRIAQRRVLILGTGAFARVVVAELSKRGCADIWVHSATGRAARFAATHPVSAVPTGELDDALARAELVVACSGGHNVVLTGRLMAQARFGADAALPVIDLSQGRDVEPAAAAVPGVDIIDLDTVGECAPSAGAPQILAARKLVEQAVATFMHIEGGRAADPAVIAMRSHIMGIIEAEMGVVARRYPDEVAAAVAQSLRRVSNELMHTPSVRAHELARTGDLDDYRRAMRTLFGIDVTDAQAAQGR